MRMFGSGAVGRKSLLPNFKELKESLHDLAGFRVEGVSEALVRVIERGGVL